jgi:hypothetical protein
MATKNKINRLYFPLLIVASSVFLLVSAAHSFLLFHSLLEIFTAVIALSTFLVAWSSRRYINNNFLLVLGIGYLFVGTLDILHMLSYKGMNVFAAGYGSNLPTQLWVAARYFESIAFLLALLFFKDNQEADFTLTRKKGNKIFFAGAAIFLLILLSVFIWHNFPTAYREGTGLTEFKKISEYIIIILFIFSLGIIYRKRTLFDREMFGLISLSLAVKILAEFSFTEYVSFYDFSNVLGHIFKYISFLLIYRAVIDIGLSRPFRFLFLNLKKSEQEAKYLARFPEENPNPVMRVTAEGFLEYGNEPAKKLLASLGWTAGMIVPPSIFSAVQKVLKNFENSELEMQNSTGRIYSFVISSNGSDNAANLYGDDVTERRKVERELLDSQRERRKEAESKLQESYQHLGMVNRRIALLLDIEKKAQTEKSKQDIAEYVLESVMNLSGAKTALLYRNAEEGFFEILVEKGLEEKHRSDFRKISVANIAFAEKLKDEKSRINGPCQQFSPCCFKINLGFKYFTVLPLARNEKLRGFIFLGFDDRVSMDPEELEFLDVFTTYATIALFTAKILK